MGKGGQGDKERGLRWKNFTEGKYRNESVLPGKLAKRRGKKKFGGGR